MKPRSLCWWVTNYSGWYWQERGWTKEPSTKHPYSNVAHAQTKRKALSIALQCPVEMTLLYMKTTKSGRSVKEIVLAPQ